MYFIYILVLITFLVSVTNINSEETDEIEEKPYCSLYNDCDKCILCQDFENCNYYNILCYQNKSADYKKNDELKNNLSLYFNNDIDIINFCHSRNITLNSDIKSFIIFESPFNKLKRSYHCDYYITNKYYLKHDSDKAKINFELKKRNSNSNLENNNINFFLIFLYKSKGKWRFYNFDSEHLRNSIFSKELKEISELEILLDFFNSENNITNTNENLILSITIEKSTDNLKKIYKAIIIVLCIFLLVIIITAITFIMFRKKLLLNQERQIRQEKAKSEKNKKLIEKFKKYELKPLIFNEKINFNNCDTCSICCENFIIGKSEVSITPCSHIFHHKCIIKWVNEKSENPNCPNCNFKFIEYMENPIKKIQIKRKRKKIDYDENKTNAINMKNTMNSMNLDEDKIKRHNSEDLPSSEYLRIKILPKNKNQIEKNSENNDKSGQLTLGEYFGNRNNNLIEQN